MKAKSYNVSKNRVISLEKKVLELSVKKNGGGMIKESEIIAFLLDKYLNKIDIKNKDLYIDE